MTQTAKTDNNEVILRATGLKKSYPLGREHVQVLKNVNLRVRRGEFVSIMGASGSGKSTLLHILGLLDKPDAGHVHFEDREVFGLSGRAQDRLRSREIGFVFQFYHLLPELNVEENVMLPMMVDSSIWNWWTRRGRSRQRARDVLEQVSLSPQAHQRPATLSGGERQRAAIARALVQRPKLLLADEPTGNLDSRAGKAILDVLTTLNAAGQTIVMVTHDTAVAELSQRRLVLRDGQLQG